MNRRSRFKKDADIKISGDYFKRYEMVSSSKYVTAIVTSVTKRVNATTLTIRPYKVPEKKMARIFKLFWLKLQLHYS